MVAEEWERVNSLKLHQLRTINRKCSRNLKFSTFVTQVGSRSVQGAGWDGF